MKDGRFGYIEVSHSASNCAKHSSQRPLSHSNSKKPAMENYQRSTAADSKKSAESIIHEEKQMEGPTATAVDDYSGAVAKTNPAEIALVRKLDRMIMVSMSS